jgi:hypothetical protein
MSLFEKGRAKTGGRRKGVKDRIGTMFLEELAKDFAEHGPIVIRLAHIELRQLPTGRVVRYMRERLSGGIVASYSVCFDGRPGRNVVVRRCDRRFHAPRAHRG